MAENIPYGAVGLLSFCGFAWITCLIMHFCKFWSSRRSEWSRSEKPVIWDVWIDKHPKTTSAWNVVMVCLCFMASSFLRPFNVKLTISPSPQPLNLTYDRSEKFRSLGGGTTNVQLRPRESDDGSHSDLTATDCSVSVFISMPTPCEHPSTEFGGGFTIGTAEVVYRYPDLPRS